MPTLCKPPFHVSRQEDSFQESKLVFFGWHDFRVSNQSILARLLLLLLLQRTNDNDGRERKKKRHTSSLAAQKKKKGMLKKTKKPKNHQVGKGKT